MKMDRNLNGDGLGKYAVINLRNLKRYMNVPEVKEALEVLKAADALEWGRTGEPDEFFLIKLKDINAEHALVAYADQANHNGDKEFAGEVYELARRSGRHNPHCKHPD